MVIKIGLENINIFFQRKSIKKTYLRVTNKREILITSPLNLKEEDLKQLINENYEWLKAKLEKVKIIDIGKDEFMLFGKKYQVKYNKVKQIEINNDIIVTDKISSIELYGIELISKRFNEMVCELQIPFKPIINFRKMHSRWGVCHYKDNKIVINKVLIHVPMRIVEYVMYHELAHFKEPNHSKSFYQELFKICPDHRKLKSQLSEYSSLL